jgi:hypothetical protein
MNEQFSEWITSLVQSSCSSHTLNDITHLLDKQVNNHNLPVFISQSLSSLKRLAHWTWELLGQSSLEWCSQPQYIDLLTILAAWNRAMIFCHHHTIEEETKSSLLIPDTIESFDPIFTHLDTINDLNHVYFRLISRWFDNLAYLLHEHTQFQNSPIIIHLQRYIGRSFVLTDQYKSYLVELKQTSSAFSLRQLFYIRTCSFLFRMYAASKSEKVGFHAEDFLDRYGEDYLQIILVHQHDVQDWNEDLLSCITHLVDFICSCCWWGDDRAIHIRRLLATEQATYEYIQALITIFSHTPFHEHIASQWSNNETILIDSTLIFFLGTLLQIKNMISVIRSEVNLSTVLLSIAQKSSYDRISVCAYGILAEILTDQQLKEVQITDNICQFFFRILDHAWRHPTQRYKRIAIPQLLTGRQRRIHLDLFLFFIRSF